MDRKRDRVLAIIRRSKRTPYNDPSIPPQPATFLGLALELRLATYGQVLAAELPIRLRRAPRYLGRSSAKEYQLAAIVCVNRQLYSEALPVLYEVNTISIDHVALNPMKMPFRTPLISSFRVSHWSLDAKEQQELQKRSVRLSRMLRSDKPYRPLQWLELVKMLKQWPRLRKVRVELYQYQGFHGLHEELYLAQVWSEVRCRGGDILFEERIIGAHVPTHLDIRVQDRFLADVWRIYLEISSRAPLPPTVLAWKASRQLIHAIPEKVKAGRPDVVAMIHMAHLISMYDQNHMVPVALAQIVWETSTIVDYRTIEAVGNAEMTARFTRALAVVLQQRP
ncbi:hypothetical protein LTR42_005148 [Elasticomyces elasticus]|nr:hypothetical protein LTR42_005148 [Elasticomyces elasticus]